MSCAALLGAIDSGAPSRICRWSSIPPTCNAVIWFSRAIPPRYAQTRPQIVGEPTFAAFCAEDDVVVQSGVGVGHVVSLLSDGARNRRWSVQPSLRDATIVSVSRPWVETHGYRRGVATRRTRRSWRGSPIRGLKPTATVVASLRDEHDCGAHRRPWVETHGYGNPVSDEPSS